MRRQRHHDRQHLLTRSTLQIISLVIFQCFSIWMLSIYIIIHFIATTKSDQFQSHLPFRFTFAFRQKDATAEFNYFHLQWRREITNMFYSLFPLIIYVPNLKTEYS